MTATTTNTQAIIKFYTDYMKSEANKGTHAFLIPDEMKSFVYKTFPDWKKQFIDYPLYIYKYYNTLVLRHKPETYKGELDSKFYEEILQREKPAPLVSEVCTEPEQKQELEAEFEDKTELFYKPVFTYTNDFIIQQARFNNLFFIKPEYSAKDLTTFSVELYQLLFQFTFNTPNNLKIFKLSPKEVFDTVTGTKLKNYPKTFRDAAKEVIKNFDC